MRITGVSKAAAAVCWLLALCLRSARVHVAGQGMFPSTATVLGTGNSALKLQQQYKNSQAWKRSYRLSPKSACSKTSTGSATDPSANLCAPSAAAAQTMEQTTQLMLATSPQVYSSIDPLCTSGLNLAGPVGNQNPCDTCTVFAVTSAAEMAVAAVLRVDIQQVSYSPQSLYYCSGVPRDCTAGWNLPEAIKQIEAQFRQTPTTPCLPYKPDPTGLLTPRQLCQGPCAAVQPYAAQGQLSFKQISSPAAAQQHIRQYGGVVSRFDVYDDFRPFFASRANVKKVYMPGKGAKVAFSHAVVLVGYDNKQQYWLVKNSWGPDWGDGGYFRVGFDTCSILTTGTGEAYGLIWTALDPWRLPVTPASTNGCYLYTAQPGDYPSKIAAVAKIPLDAFMLNNTANIKDLDWPLAGTKLIMCNPATGMIIDIKADPTLVALQRLRAMVDANNTIVDWTVPASLADSADASSAYCSWRGIVCVKDARSGRQHVQQINLNKYQKYDGLVGVLPTADVLKAVLGLTEIDIGQYGGIKGTIPSQWSQLIDLDDIRVTGNALTGMLPESFAALTRLKVFYAYRNNISGTLPSAYKALSNLEKLDVSNNHLSGVLPESWGPTLVGLRKLSIGNNRLSGTLPHIYSELSTLQEMLLTNNTLGGTLPSSWSLLVNLQDLRLAYNKLVGPLPATWGTALKSLTVLYLSHNSLTGPIPDSWGSGMSAMGDLSLTRCNLSGTLPSSLGQMSKLYSLGLGGNDFAGTIPSSWGSLSNLSEVYLWGNHLRGPLPVSWGSKLKSLAVIDLSDNRLTGPIPDSWGSLSALGDLDLTRCNLSGTLPSSLGQMSNLDSLGLGGNDFVGTIPSSWGSLTKLKEAYLWGNHLVGPLPVSWGSKLKFLALMNLSENKLTGTIPDSWGSLSSMGDLDLTRCNLSGTLPSSLGQMSKLYSLGLGGNSFIGTIPSSWGHLTNLTAVYLWGNKGLKGCIPRAWQDVLPPGYNLQAQVLEGTQLSGFC